MTDNYYTKVLDSRKNSISGEDLDTCGDEYVKDIITDLPDKCSVAPDDEDPYKPWEETMDFDISPDTNPHHDPLKGSSKAFLVFRLVNLVYWVAEMGLAIYFSAVVKDPKQLCNTGFVATIVMT